MKQQSYCYNSSPNNGAAFEKTCSLTSLFSLKKHDRLHVENVYGANVIVSNATAYFGAVLIH